MASTIHAGIPSSDWVNPPKTPPFIHPSRLGNLTLPSTLFAWRAFFSFLFILPFLHGYTAVIAAVYCVLSCELQGENHENDA